MKADRIAEATGGGGLQCSPPDAERYEISRGCEGRRTLLRSGRRHGRADVNPHSHLIVRIDPGAKDSLTTGIWDIELQSVNILSKQGWNRVTYKVGDHAVIIAHPMRDGSKGASIFYAIMPDGKRLYGDIAQGRTTGLQTNESPAPVQGHCRLQIENAK